MIQTQAVITEREIISGAWWRFTISGVEIATNFRPGQFLLLRCGPGCYLRRPIFPQVLGDKSLSLLVRPDPDPGLAWLSARQVGDKLDLIGPLGQGFPLPYGHNNILLVSDGQKIDPLLGQMRQALKAGFSVTLALEASRVANLYPTVYLPPDVEFQAATLDGSLGYQGSLAPLLPDLLRWADLVCAVGSRKLYRMLKKQSRDIRLGWQHNYLYGLVSHKLLACGMGACFGCTIKTKKGLTLICTNGPIFDLTDLDFDGV